MQRRKMKRGRLLESLKWRLLPEDRLTRWMMLVWLIIVIAATLSGCQTTKVAEPEVSPTFFYALPASGKCEFVDDSEDGKITFFAKKSDGRYVIDDYALISLLDLAKLKHKISRCERWR